MGIIKSVALGRELQILQLTALLPLHFFFFFQIYFLGADNKHTERERVVVEGTSEMQLSEKNEK